MSAAAFCNKCRTVVRVRDGRYVEHYVRGSRCPWSGEPVGGPPPAPPRARSSCAHSSTMRLGDRRVCSDCGEPR